MENLALILEKWYEEHHRDLPWRNTSDPYTIWISEIILQQTRVAQGYQYFLKFMDAFPTVRHLAEAREDDVLRMWQGLGYYSRARNLHEAACQIRDRGYRFPDSYQEVRRLKGVGDYTAAAICAFAYGLPCAVVDGNVYRVLARWMGINLPIDTAEGKRYFAEMAQTWLDKEHPALYNQAIMDFGALQCVPQSPDCSACPLVGACVAYHENAVGAYPVKSHRTKVEVRYFYYLYVRAGKYTYLYKRQHKDIWQNMYDLPLIESGKPLDEAEFYERVQAERWIADGECPVMHMVRRDVKHVLSHRVIYATFYEVELPENTRSFSGFLKIREDERDQYAMSRLLTRFLDALGR